MEDPNHDRSLWQRTALGDDAAFEELIADYLPQLRAFVRGRLDRELARRESCSDLIQSVCRELVEHRDRFDFRGDSQFRGWLFTTALNKIREKYRLHRAARRDSRRVGDPDGTTSERFSVSDAAAPGAGPASIAAMREDLARLERAVDRLSDDHRQVVSLARVQGLPLPEVAERMGRSTDATRMLLGRALVQLARLMEADEN